MARWTQGIIGVAIAIALVSCASTAPPADTTVTTTETTTTVTRTAAPSLASTNWKVVEMRSAPYDQPTTTLVFDSAGRISGTTGCNNYTSTVTYEGTDIHFAPVVVTRITCTDTTRLADERRFLEGFATLKAYELNPGGDLLLKDASGTTVIRLQRVP